MISADARAVRDSAHIACDGAEESTSMPASRPIDSSGLPTASQMADSAPGPIDAIDDTTIAFSNICWMCGSIDLARAISAQSSSCVRSGLVSRRCSASALSASRNGRPSVDITQPIVAPSAASCFGETCHASSTYCGTSSRSSKNALSMASGLAPGIRAPSRRVSDSGLYG